MAQSAAPTIVVQGRPPADPTSSVPVTLQAFAMTIKGTPQEVWTTLLRQSHGRERHTFQDWQNLIGLHSKSKA